MRILVQAAMAAASVASLELSNTLGSNMVLQRDRPNPIWGWASTGTIVTTTFAGQSWTATAAGPAGLWKQMLPAQSATTVGRTIKVQTRGQPTVTLSNVVFGEVIFCSGRKLTLHNDR